MKRTFLRILPLAVAVLLATSCSKDDNNTNEVVNNGQETVQTKTLPVLITVNQKGLSKLSCANGTGVDLQPIFETTDKLAIYNGETFLTDLVIKEGSISEDGKTATFEGEIVADGIVDGTELTAKIGTPLTDAITATSREDAVQYGCYQISAPFVYSKDGNSIALEEQNAYIEVVWENKGNATVEFTVNDSKTVSLTLNGQGQGWIVVPAGTTFTCADLGLTSEITTAAANIYGINREFSAVPGGYVDLGVTVGTQHIYFEKSDTYDHRAWQADQEYWPTVAEWAALKDQCYWKLADDNGGYYVFKAHDNNDAGKVTNQSSTSYTPSVAYSTATEPYIFLPVTDDLKGYYWSSRSIGDNDAFCLYFDLDEVSQFSSSPVGSDMPGVVTVRRSN